MALKEFCCKNCGNNLENLGEGFWKCRDCGKIYKDSGDKEFLEIIAGAVGRKLSLSDVAKIEKLRTNLAISGQSKFPSYKRIESICVDLTSLVPGDSQAELYSAMCGNDTYETDRCIREYSVYAGRIYLDEDINFVVRNLKSRKNFPAVENLINLYGKVAPDKAEKVRGKFGEKEAEIKDGVRNVNVDRDIFVSYDSGDLATVYELVNFLENPLNGFRCFVADRNLPEENDPYWPNIYEAMKNCKAFLLVSSKNSRNNDNVLKEIRQWMKDDNDKRKFRAEYLIEKHEKRNLSLLEKSINKYFSDVLNWFESGKRERLAESLYEYKLQAEDESTAVNSFSVEEKKPESVKKENPATKKRELSCQELNDMAENLYEQKAYEEAVALWEKSAERGDAKAQSKLGVCYYFGEGVEQDHKEAVSWWEKSAERGDAKAQNALGYCYEFGKGVERDYKEAVSWFKKSAEQGNVDAQYNLGLCYTNGEGVEQDFKEAVRWYRKSAEQGLDEAQYNLGVSYELGEGVEQDYKEAVKWYKKSAEQGYEPAIKALNKLKK